jgi:hypothetical protein
LGVSDSFNSGGIPGIFFAVLRKTMNPASECQFGLADDPSSDLK